MIPGSGQPLEGRQGLPGLAKVQAVTADLIAAGVVDESGALVDGGES